MSIKKKSSIYQKLLAYILTMCMLCVGLSFGEMEPIQAADSTVVYFYNSEGWSEVGAHAYVDGKSLTGEWNSTKAQKASDLGDKWYKLTVKAKPQFSIIFYNRAKDSERVELAIPDSSHVYVAMDNQAHSSKSEAEKSADGNGGDSGSGNMGSMEKNPDETNMTFKGKGANLPYITYEAEAAATNAKVLEKSTTYRTDIQSEASGRQAVRLEKNGDYVEFTLKEDADAMVLRYCIPDSSDGKGIEADLSLYIDGTEKQNVALTSAYAWIYGDYPYNNTPSNKKPHRFFDEVRLSFDSTISAGSKIKLQKDSSDKAEYYIVDFIECEKREAQKKQPSGSLSVTDYGAKANDGKDDYDAFVNCINAAKKQGKEVWIPAGTFDLKEERAFDVDGVTIRGAGMWYTNLVGAGVSFHLKGTCKFHDFAMTGVSKIRDDAGDLAGFEPVGEAKNVTIENIWMEHIKVGIWSYNTTNLLIQGCRIRNTYADGMNMCSNSHYAMIRNNHVRNTGDDGIAIWPWNGDCTNNLIQNNTVQLPNLANGIALYAGNGNKVENNHVLDIVNNGSGICLGSEFDTEKGFSGTTTVSGNLLERCGSYQTDLNYPIGALWVWSTWHDMTANYVFTDNEVRNSSYEAFCLDANAKIGGVNVKNLTIDGATDAVYVHDPKASSKGAESGEATFENVAVKNYTGKLINNTLGDQFKINQKDKGIYEEKDVILDLDGFSLEGEVATLSNEAKLEIASAEGISNGGYIGYLGGAKSGTATYQIPVETEGKRVLKIYYATAQDRSVGVQVNDEPAVEVKCPKTADWQVVCQEPGQIVVNLQAGLNTLNLTGYSGGDGPNIDRIELGMSEDEAKAVVENLIANLPKELTTEATDQAMVHAVNSAYEKLSADSKAEVSGAERLKSAMEQVDGTGENPPADEETVMVIFNVSGGSEVASQTVKKGETITEPVMPVKEGYAFGGWYLSGQKFDFSTPISEDMTLVARWEETSSDEETVTVKFDAKNGTEVTAEVVYKGKTVEKPEEPKKEGYTFQGWYLNGQEYDFASPVEEDMILAAEWKAADPDQSGNGTTSGGDGQGGSTQAGGNTQTGGNDQGNTQSGGNDQGNTQSGGNNQGNTQPGGNTQTGGDNQGNTQPGGNTQIGGDNQGNTQPGGNTQTGGNTQGNTQSGDNTQIGNGNQPGVGSTSQQVPVENITIKGISKKIAAGKKITLSVTVSPENATNQEIMWESSNEKYATVDAKGVVKTKKAGKNKTVTIFAKAGDGSSVVAGYKIKLMEKAVKKIRFATTEKSIKAGQKLTLKAVVTPSGTTKEINNKLAWSSSNTSIATVNSKGIVKTKKSGKNKTVLITAQATDGSGKKCILKLRLK